MFEKFIKESFDSHLKVARQKNKKINQSFLKFGFFDFDETLFTPEGKFMLEGSDAFNCLVECLSDPEPCYIGIVTARNSNSRSFIEEKIRNNLQDLFEKFNGKFTIKTVADESLEDKPSIYEIAQLKAKTISDIITQNSDNLQETLVYFFDDVPENVEEVRKAVDRINVKTDNIFNV